MRSRLHLMALSLAAWVALLLPPTLSEEERRLVEEVREAHSAIYLHRVERGILEGLEHDDRRSGLIGPRFSPLLTTVGDLEAKRLSTSPLWAVALRRILLERGVRRLAVVSSASFPALLLSTLKAAESLGIEVRFAVSLGGSNYGAIHPDLPWPAVELLLRERGLLRSRASFYTPGGADESGRGLPPQALSVMRHHADRAGVRLLEGSTAEALSAKLQLLEEGVDMLVNVGAPYTSFAGDEELAGRGGLLLPREVRAEGGLVGEALARGIPVLNLVGIRGLARELGIPEGGREETLPPRGRRWRALGGLGLFSLWLPWLRRWWYEALP